MVEVSGICSHPSLNYKVESNACCCSPGFLFSMTFKTWPRYHPQWASIPTSNPIKIISHGHAQVVLGIIDSTINTADHKGRGTGVFAHVLHSLFKSVPKTREFHKSFNQTYIKALSGFSTVLGQHVTLAADNDPCSLMEWDLRGGQCYRTQHTDYFKMNVWCCGIYHPTLFQSLCYLMYFASYMHSIQRGKKTDLV